MEIALLLIALVLLSQPSSLPTQANLPTLAASNPIQPTVSVSTSQLPPVPQFQPPPTYFPGLQILGKRLGIAPPPPPPTPLAALKTTAATRLQIVGAVV